MYVSDSRYQLSFEPRSLRVTTTEGGIVVWAGAAPHTYRHTVWPKAWGASLEATATESELLRRLLAAGAPGVSVAQARAALEVQGGHLGRTLNLLKRGRRSKLGDGKPPSAEPHERRFARAAATAASPSTSGGSEASTAETAAAATATDGDDDDEAARYRLSFEGGAASDGTTLMRVGPPALFARPCEPSSLPSSPPTTPSPLPVTPPTTAVPSPSEAYVPSADEPDLWYWSGTGLFPKTRCTWDPAYGRRRRPSPPREAGARTLYSPLPPFYPEPPRSFGSSGGGGESSPSPLPRAGTGEVHPSTTEQPRFSKGVETPLGSAARASTAALRRRR